MANFLQSLPLDIPWQLVAASPDMMDAQFCDDRFPYAWRSSLALFAFEPKIEDLPESTCGQRLTFLKVTASITGYTPSADEVARAKVDYPSIPVSVLNEVIGEYWGCYGALLNVAVHPMASREDTPTPKEAMAEFANFDPAVRHPDPLTVAGFRFDAIAGTSAAIGSNRIAVVDGIRVLDLDKEMQITLPFPAQEVLLEVIQKAGPIDVVGLAAGNVAARDANQGNQGGAYSITLSANLIDAVRLTSPSNEAFLARITARGNLIENSLGAYPHIFDIEPKMRDLYQGATESGEILTASVSRAATGKSLTHTNSTEVGLSLGGEVNTSPGAGGGWGGKGTAGFSAKWGSTTSDTRTMTTDSSRESRESEGTVTSLSQLYNLLTGYHVGTNRATFLMLPRPHTLQPTIYRTLVKGLRMIEGIQEFLLVVMRPVDQKQLCIDLRLETGHFPEEVTVDVPPLDYEPKDLTFLATATAPGGNVSAQVVHLEDFPACNYTLPSGWVVDLRRGDFGHPGLTEGLDTSNAMTNLAGHLNSHSYQATSDSTVQIMGELNGDGGINGGAAIFARYYTIHMRSQSPRPPPRSAVVTTPFLATRRSLCACFRSGEACVELIEHALDLKPEMPGIPLVYEGVVAAPTALLQLQLGATETALPPSAAITRLLHEGVRTALTSAAAVQAGGRKAPLTFLRSDTFRDRIVSLMPRHEDGTIEVLAQPVTELVPEASSVVPPGLAQRPAGEVLHLSLTELGNALGGNTEQAGALRAYLLRRVASAAFGGEHERRPRRLGEERD